MSTAEAARERIVDDLLFELVVLSGIKLEDDLDATDIKISVCGAEGTATRIVSRRHYRFGVAANDEGALALSQNAYLQKALEIFKRIRLIVEEADSYRVVVQLPHKAHGRLKSAIVSHGTPDIPSDALRIADVVVMPAVRH